MAEITINRNKNVDPANESLRSRKAKLSLEHNGCVRNAFYEFIRALIWESGIKADDETEEDVNKVVKAYADDMYLSVIPSFLDDISQFNEDILHPNYIVELWDEDDKCIIHRGFSNQWRATDYLQFLADYYKKERGDDVYAIYHREPAADIVVETKIELMSNDTIIIRMTKA